MSSKTGWSLLFVVALVFGALFYLWDNFVWYSLPFDKRHELAANKDPRSKKVIPLGLDLQGGAHLVYQVDISKLPDLSDETVTRAIDQNMVVITNRVDALGVANAFVARQGREFIVIQLPGFYESQQAKDVIGRTALLEFRMVKENEALVNILQELEKQSIRPEQVVSGTLPEPIKKLIPEGMVLLPSREGGYLLVNAVADLTGGYLKGAHVQFGNEGGMLVAAGPSIGFELNADGAKLFEAITGAHIGERLAIVLDNVIQSAPRIEGRIPGGQGQITGTFSTQEAKLLANILNSGNLQAPMSVVEERTVGPELGEDSIRSGVQAVLLGFGLVVLFMLVYYKMSGFFADIALLINLVLLFACMNFLRANLTLPGLAGVILSVAMSVDANIIILERVREELRRGKQIRHAIEEGYEKATSAILDGNVTAIIAALFLFQFGPGPVKGFGITLIIGLVISMFSCVYITKMMYDVWFSVFRPEKLSI